MVHLDCVYWSIYICIKLIYIMLMALCGFISIKADVCQITSFLSHSLVNFAEIAKKGQQLTTPKPLLCFSPTPPEVHGVFKNHGRKLPRDSSAGAKINKLAADLAKLLKPTAASSVPWDVFVVVFWRRSWWQWMDVGFVFLGCFFFLFCFPVDIHNGRMFWEFGFLDFVLLFAFYKETKSVFEY